jgi:hypothetical protein
MRKPKLAHGESTLPRCGYELYAHRHNVVQRSLALVIAALLLYIPANFLPIMQLNILGQSSQDTVWSGVLGLFNTDMQGVSIVVFLCSMAIPLLKLLCQLFVLLTIRFNVGRSYGLLLYRIYHHLKIGACSRFTSWASSWRSSNWRTWRHHRRPRSGVFHRFVVGSGLAGSGDVTAPDLAGVIRRGCPCGRLMQAF